MTGAVSSLFDLTSLRAVVTGGGRGLGRALARCLAQAGAFVHVAARTTTVTSVAAEIEDAGGHAAAHVMDVRDATQVQQFFQEIGPVDIVVHAPAVYLKLPAVDVSSEDWHQSIEVNLNGAFYVTRDAARSMLQNGRPGSIVLVSSVQAFLAQRNRVAYAASKAAMVQMVRSFAYELGSHGIRVNALLPGFFQTESNADRYADEAFVDRLSKIVPLQRPGSAKELFAALLYLVSPSSTYTTGSVVVVDGGLTSGIAV